MKNLRFKKLAALLLVFILTIGLISGCIRANDEVQENQEVEENQNEQNENQKEEQNQAEDAQYPMDIEDDFGNKVTIDSVPEKIVSLAPSHTEILFSLGLDEKIVGVTNFCDYPEAAQSKEKIGDAMSVNIEKVIELDPDLVVQYGPGNEEVNQKLRDAGIALLSYEPESIDEVIEVITEIGKVTQTGMAATMVTVDMMSKRDYIVHRVEGAEKPKVFYELWNEPLMTAGPGSFLNELITLGGGENIAADAQGEYPQFELEQLLERDPEVYITAQDTEDKTVESIKAREGYETINAIKNNRVYVLDPNIISRPGPRIVDGLEMVAKSIHPELFNK